MTRFELNSKVFCLYLIVLTFVTTFSAQDYGADFHRIESIPGTTTTLFTVYSKHNRNERRELCASTNMTFVEDFGNEFKISISNAISSFGNDNFVQSRMKIPPKKFCEFVNTTYRYFFEPSFPDPKIPPEGLCPFPKGTYEVKCLKIMVTDKWPSHLPNGLWRLTASITKNDELIGGYIIYANVYSIK